MKTLARFGRFALMVGVSLALSRSAPAQQPRTVAAAVERLGDHSFRVGSIHVDTASAELLVPGKINGNVSVLEFVANTAKGFKAYESAIGLDTNGVTFNTACLLIGLDPAHAVRPTRHFDPKPPEGDEVEVKIRWQDHGTTREIDAEQLLYDREKKKAVTGSRWVYTGSRLVEGGWFLADVDGVVIGFVHSPSPVIENVAADAVGRYGWIVLNPNLGLAADTPITLVVKAVRKTK